MSFISDLLIEISSFRIRVGNKLNALANRIGDLTALTTSNKTDIVGAINEVRSSVPTNYVTTNTNQTGLSGNKTTNGIWEYTNPNGLHISAGLGRVKLGRQSSDGDVSVGSSGLGSPPTGTTQDYGFYLAYNAFRDSDGHWKHSRQTSVIANIFKGGHHTGGFSWGYSPNVGAGNVDFTELMKLSNNGELKLNSTSANVLKIERTNSANTNIEYINSGISIFAGNVNGSVFSIGENAALTTVAYRWMWVDNTGRVYSKNGFAINGQNDTQMLLAGGGHRPVSDFVLSGNLGDYLPLSGGTMNSGAVINWSGAQAFIQIGGISKLRFSNTITVLSSSVPQGGSYGIYLRPQGDASTGGQVIIDGNGQINTSSHGNSSQWKQAFDWGNFRDYGLGTEAVVNTGLLENTNETGFYAFSTSQQGFNYPRAMIMKRGSQNYGLIFQNSGDKVGFLTSDGSVYTAWHSGNFNPSDYAATSSVAYYNDGDNVNSNVAWGSNVVGGARNQIQGGRNIVKGEDINIFGSRNVSSGINNQINGFANVVTGAFNTLTGAYSSIAGSQANILGNYLFARDKQTVLGMYNKVYNLGDDEGLRFAFGTGMNDLDKFNAVEIYDDHRTEFHGKAQYNEETRNPEWFTEDYTHVDTYQMGYDHLTHRAPGSTPCEANILRLAVRHGSNSASNDDRFTAVADLKKAFNVHGIVDGSIFDGTINVNRIHTKGTLEFSPTTTSKLITDAKIDTKNLLIVRYNFGKGLVDIIGYTDSASLLSHKTEPSSVTVLLGSFILRKNNLGQPVAFFEFNQQII